MAWGDKTRIKEAVFYEKRARELNEIGMTYTAKMFSELAKEVRLKVSILKAENNTGS